MKFGTRSADVPVYSGDSYIRNLKKGETTLRFMQECEDWVMYREHYGNDKSFPCTGDRSTCPGCTDPDERVNRSSRKYATNVLMQPSNQQLVVKMPVTLAARMEARSERNDGTILTRDYVVIKSGQGLDTEYDVDNGDKYAVDLSGYKLFDIEEMLKSAFMDGTGIDPDSQDKPTRKAPVTKQVPAKSDLPDDPPFSEPQDEEYVTEAELRKMTLIQLTNLANEAKLPVPTTITEKGEMIDFLMEQLAEE